MLRSLTLLAFFTTCAGVAVVACDKSDTSTTMTTGALYAADSGVATPVLTPPADNGAPSEPSMAARPSDPNALPASTLPRNVNGATGAPLPRAMAPDSPANGTYGADGTGSLNGARPMNQPGSSASPYRSGKGDTDAPHPVPTQPSTTR